MKFCQNKFSYLMFNTLKKGFNRFLMLLLIKLFLLRGLDDVKSINSLEI